MPEQIKNNVIGSKITSALGIAAMILGIVGVDVDPAEAAGISDWITANSSTIGLVVMGLVGLVAKEN